MDERGLRFVRRLDLFDLFQVQRTAGLGEDLAQEYDFVLQREAVFLFSAFELRALLCFGPGF